MSWHNQNKTLVDKNIHEVVCRVKGTITYRAQKFTRCKQFDTIEEARKYIDRVCIELGKPQVYNTFKSV